MSGRVSLDGAPLDQATIVFIPADPAAGRKTGAEIIAGRFTIDAADGAAVGTCRVEIATYVGPKFHGPLGPATRPAFHPHRPPTARQVPGLYNVESLLKVEIEADGTNQFEFELFTTDPSRFTIQHERATPHE